MAGRLLRAPDHDAAGAGDAGDGAADGVAAGAEGSDAAAAAAGAGSGEDDESLDLGKGDDKGDEGAAGGDGKGEDDKPAANAELFGAPAEGEAYTIEGLPEGMAVDQEALAAIEPIARQLNLSPKGLSLFAQTYAEKVLPSIQARFQTDLEGQITAQRTAWETEARQAIAGKDAAGNPVELKNEVGGTLNFDGKDLKGVKAIAAKALDHLAPAGFRAWLDETGMGVNPNLIAFCYNAGKAIKEDTDHEQGGGDVVKSKSRVEKYYGNSGS